MMMDGGCNEFVLWEKCLVTESPHVHAGTHVNQVITPAGALNVTFSSPYDSVPPLAQPD